MDGSDSKRPAAPDLSPSRFRNLSVRLASAVLMLAVSLTALFAGSPYWPLLVLGLAIGTGWEWNRMLSRSGRPEALALLAGIAVVTGLAAVDLPAMAVVAAVAGSIVLAALGPDASRRIHAAGLVYFGLPVVALLWIAADGTHGPLALLFVLLIVWVTDSVAFFAGRMIGGPKLWPSVSPNKTWAGSLGGAAGAIVAGLIFAGFAGVRPLLWIAALSLFLSIACQAGDLMESALKRRFDRKDSSGLIPGHGGLMDRLDGLIVAMLLAAGLGLVTDPARPAMALLPGLGP